MTEEFTSLSVAYLLEELDPAVRAHFEARLAEDPAAVAELKEVADQLRTLAEAQSPPLALPEPLRQEMLEQILKRRSRPAERIAVGFRRVAWPLAAAILLALNVAQWLHNRRARDPGAGAAPMALSGPGRSPVPSAAGRAPAVPVAVAPSPLHRDPLPTVPTTRASIRQTVTFTIVQTTVTASSVARVVREENVPAQQGALELHNLPRTPNDRSLFLWARRAGMEGYEPVGEIPRQLYGGSGTINYQLRPGAGAAVHFMVTIEVAQRVPPAPSTEVVCAGP